MTRATSTTFARRIGKAIAAARREAERSQGGVARALGTTTATVSRWESGAQMPNAERIVQLAKLLGVTPNELLGW